MVVYGVQEGDGRHPAQRWPRSSATLCARVVSSVGDVVIRFDQVAYDSHQRRVNAKPSSVAGRGRVGRLELSLPYPPSLNHYWRRNKGPGMHISDEGKAFRACVVALCAIVGHVPGRVAVQVIAYPPDRRARDLDNILKGLLDALQHARAIENDSLIDSLLISRGERCKGGRVDVVVTTCN